MSAVSLETATIDGRPAIDHSRAARLSSVSIRASIIAACIFVAIGSLWYLATEYGWVSPLLVAPPASVFSTLAQMVVSGSLWPNLIATASVTLLGVLAALVSGFVFAVVFVFSEALQRAVTPYLVIIQTFPKIAIAPLILAALGYGLGPKVFIAGLLAFFPILMNTMVGLSSVSDDQLALFRSVGAGRFRVLFRLRIPNSVSFIIPALSTAAVLALIGTIVSEFVSAKAGLGFAIQAATQVGSVSTTYAVLIVLGCFGVSIWLIISLLKRLLSRYMK